MAAPRGDSAEKDAGHKINWSLWHRPAHTATQSAVQIQLLFILEPQSGDFHVPSSIATLFVPLLGDSSWEYNG